MTGSPLRCRPETGTPIRVARTEGTSHGVPSRPMSRRTRAQHYVSGMSDASTPEHRPLLCGRGRFLDDLVPGGRHARARLRPEPVGACTDPVDRGGRGAPRAGGGSGGDGGGSRRYHGSHPDGDGDRGKCALPAHRLASGGPRNGPLHGGDRGRGRRAQPVPRRGRGGPRRGRLRAPPGGRGRPFGVGRGRAPPPRARTGQRALPHRVDVRGEGAGAVRAGADPGPLHLPAPPRLGHADGGERRGRRVRPDERDPRVPLLHPGAPHPAGRPRPEPGARGEPDPGRRPGRRWRLRPQGCSSSRRR